MNKVIYEKKNCIAYIMLNRPDWESLNMVERTLRYTGADPLKA